MDFSHIMEVLEDERCGLFFLAGLDKGAGSNGSDLLTVHAADGTMNDEQVAFIEAAVSRMKGRPDVKVRFHSPNELCAPDSLESFVSRFSHDHILADPTGAFARAPELLKLAASLRSELGGLLSRVLWRSKDSVLVCLVTPDALTVTPSGDAEAAAPIRARINDQVARFTGQKLVKVISSVQVVPILPAGQHVPVDRLSVPEPVSVRKTSGLLARVAKIAALVGLGTLSATAAANATTEDDAQFHAPALAALTGLTVLGENSYGIRNPYQAVGGLRLYLGDAGFLLVSSVGDGNRFCLDHLQKTDKAGNRQSTPIPCPEGLT